MSPKQIVDVGVTTIVGGSAGIAAKIEIFGLSLGELKPVFFASMTTIWYAFLGVLAAFITKVLLGKFIKKYFPKLSKFL